MDGRIRRYYSSGGCLYITHTLSPLQFFKYTPASGKGLNVSILLQRCSITSQPSHSPPLLFLPFKVESNTAGFALYIRIVLEKPTAWLGRPFQVYGGYGSDGYLMINITSKFTKYGITGASKPGPAFIKNLRMGGRVAHLYPPLHQNLNRPTCKERQPQEGSNRRQSKGFRLGLV